MRFPPFLHLPVLLDDGYHHQVQAEDTGEDSYDGSKVVDYDFGDPHQDRAEDPFYSYWVL